MHNISVPTSVSCEWLEKHLAVENIIIIDCHCQVGEPDLDNYTKYLNCHIPNAKFCCIDDISDPTSSIPHQLPSEEQFTEFAKALNLRPQTPIVCYSSGRILAAPRVWWMLRVFGFDNVGVLNASLKEWQLLSLPTASKHQNKPTTTNYPNYPHDLNFSYNQHLIANIKDVKRISTVKDSRKKIVDARSEGRFLGTSEEPRKGLPSGHIPNSINLPFFRILKKDSFALLPDNQLKNLFKESGIDISQEHIYSCGSGVTACILAWAQATIGNPNSAVYDGSWSEWALQQ